MKTFFISDCHFSHKNIIRYESRPFSSVEVMDETMILNWNNKVSNGDRVYIVGDFIFGDEEVALNILNRLNGQKFMLKGNHDSFLKSEKVLKKFQWVKDYYKYSYNDLFAYRTWTIKILALQQYFKSRNQPYIMVGVSGIPNYKSYYELRDHFGYLWRQIDTERYVGWPHEGLQEWYRDAPLAPGGHPLELGHRKIADEIAKYIRN